MDVDRHVKAFGRLEDRHELVFVKIFALGVAIDHPALGIQPGHRAFEFAGGGGRVLRGNRGQQREAARIFAHRFVGGAVIGQAGERGSLVGGEYLHAQSAEQQHLHVNAIAVHRHDPIGQIGQRGKGAKHRCPARPLLVGRGRQIAVLSRQHFGNREMFLNGDDLVGTLDRRTGGQAVTFSAGGDDRAWGRRGLFVAGHRFVPRYVRL